MTEDMGAVLDSLAASGIAQDGKTYASLTEAGSEEAARRTGRSRREVEIAALRKNIVPERYIRNFHCLCPADQEKLASSRVAIVGLGGLGGYVLEFLARMGVGRIIGADGDTFAESNLNRQLLSNRDTLFRPKAAAAVERAKAVNPSVEVEAIEAYMDEAGLAGMLRGADVVVDCLGGLKDRLMLQRSATTAGVPMVTAAVAGWTGYVAVVMPGETGPADFLCAPSAGGEGASPCAAEDTLGCLCPTVALAASMECSETVKLLLGKTSRLRGSMIFFDLGDPVFEMLRFGA